MVVGFFSEHEDVEEDDYEDFIQAAGMYAMKRISISIIVILTRIYRNIQSYYVV